jgi:uncharacterized OsmC-like protein
MMTESVDNDDQIPDAGDGTVVATNDGGLATEVDTGEFTLTTDEPEAMGGDGSGPTPYDHLAAALASCTSMTLRMYADRKDIALDTVRTSVTFERVHAEDCRDCETGEGRVERFDRTIHLSGDIDDEDRTRLLSIANRCPVHRTLDGQIEIRTRLTD